MEEGFYIASPSPLLKLYVFVCQSVPLHTHASRLLNQRGESEEIKDALASQKYKANFQVHPQIVPKKK